MDYLYRLGGGTLELGAGTFTLRNCIYLRQNVSLRGSGAATQLKKAAGFCSRLTRDADWYENQVAKLGGQEERTKRPTLERKMKRKGKEGEGV